MHRFTRVAACAPDGVTALSLGMVSAVFAARPGLPAFDVAVCTARPGQLGTDLGVPVLVRHDLSTLAAADLVLVLPGSRFRTDATGPVPAALRLAHGRGATIAGHCAGVFLMAAAGLLDGLEATTHWEFAAELAAAFPQVTIRPEALYVDQGSIVTGAGVTAGIDMCLHLIRRGYGTATASRIARALILLPHRDGGQSQFIPAPVPANAVEPLPGPTRSARPGRSPHPACRAISEEGRSPGGCGRSPPGVMSGGHGRAGCGACAGAARAARRRGFSFPVTRAGRGAGFCPAARGAA